MELVSPVPAVSAWLSVAAALLHHHVLVMPHDHLAVLIVEHGERSQAGGDTGQARHRVWVVQLQQALQGGKRRQRGNSGVRTSGRGQNMFSLGCPGCREAWLGSGMMDVALTCM